MHLSTHNYRDEKIAVKNPRVIFNIKDSTSEESICGDIRQKWQVDKRKEKKRNDVGLFRNHYSHESWIQSGYIHNFDRTLSFKYVAH